MLTRIGHRFTPRHRPHAPLPSPHPADERQRYSHRFWPWLTMSNGSSASCPQSFRSRGLGVGSYRRGMVRGRDRAEAAGSWQTTAVAQTELGTARLPVLVSAREPGCWTERLLEKTGPDRRQNHTEAAGSCETTAAARAGDWCLYRTGMGSAWETGCPGMMTLLEMTGPDRRRNHTEAAGSCETTAAARARYWCLCRAGMGPAWEAGCPGTMTLLGKRGTRAPRPSNREGVARSSEDWAVGPVAAVIAVGTVFAVGTLVPVGALVAVGAVVAVVAVRLDTDYFQGWSA